MRSDQDRPETAVRPVGGPAALGQELRRQREIRGLTQGEMARAVGLSARSAVADYESGRRIPPDDIIESYERHFVLRPGALRHHRDQLHAQKAEQRFAATPTVAAAQPADPPRARSATASTTRLRTPTVRRILIPTVLLACLCLLTAASAAAVGTRVQPGLDPAWTELTQNVTDRSLANTAPQSMDGDDPRARDCSADALTTYEVPLKLPGGTPFGTLRLRHSKHCETSWGSAYYSNPQLYTIRITVHRPEDDAIVRDDWSNNTPPGSYSDMLSTSAEIGCVWVEAVVITPAGTSVPAKTGCSDQ